MNEIITERPNLFEPDAYIAVCAEIAGNVCPQALTAAVLEAYRANEAAMSKIVLRDGAAFYEKLPVSGCKAEISDKNWIELIQQNEKIPFALDRGELIRTFILPAETKTQIVVMAHHLAGDGKSIVYFVKDILSALSGIPLILKPFALLENALPETGLPFFAKRYARYCTRKWDNRCFTWQDYYALHDRYWSAFTSDIRYHTLSSLETEQVVKNAKQTGCSVNSYLVAALLSRNKNLREVGIPVSIRESGNEAMANLTSGIQIRHRYDFKKGFAENALKIHSKIKKEILQNRVSVLQFLAALPGTLIDAVLLSAHGCCANRLALQAAKVMGYAENTKRDLGISNLTVLDIPTRYGCFWLENVIFVPPAVSYTHNVYGISTFNGQMTVTYHRMVQAQ